MSAPREGRSLAGVLVYYMALGAGIAALFRWVPSWSDLFSGARLDQLPGIPRELGGEGGFIPVATDWESAAIAMVGALILVIPVAWVYIITKRRQGYDPSVVQTPIILPIAVSGIVMIVQRSIALAFSLAGIVAAVRFRNTLKDTKDAVYVFLAIGVGLAAGVQTFGVALVMSIVFNVVVLALWYFNIGNIYAMEAAASNPSAAAGNDSGEKGFHGLLRIRSTDLDAAMSVVEAVLRDDTKKWRHVGSLEADGGGVLEYFVRFKKKKPAQSVLTTIQQRGEDLGLEIDYTAMTG